MAPRLCWFSKWPRLCWFEGMRSGDFHRDVGEFGAPDSGEDPAIRRSNWDGYYLSDAQVLYACVDAYVAFLLGKCFMAWNWNAGEEFDEDYDGEDYGMKIK